MPILSGERKKVHCHSQRFSSNSTISVFPRADGKNRRSCELQSRGGSCRMGTAKAMHCRTNPETFTKFHKRKKDRNNMKRTTKKSLALLSTAAFALSMLAGCS